jgi:CRISPR-associated protein Cas5t
VAQAREFWESYSHPPPSTVYGMLCSLVGEPNRLVHAGAELALALISAPERSVVLRTLWRVKNENMPAGLGENKRPDLQELLTDVRLSLWIRPGPDECKPPLAHRVRQAIKTPASLERFGGLALGESTHLIDEIRAWRASDPKEGELLVHDNAGELALPVWADHVGSAGTRFGQFRLERTLLELTPPDRAWIAIKPA